MFQEIGGNKIEALLVFAPLPVIVLSVSVSQNMILLSLPWPLVLETCICLGHHMYSSQGINLFVFY